MGRAEPTGRARSGPARAPEQPARVSERAGQSAGAGRQSAEEGPHTAEDCYASCHWRCSALFVPWVRRQRRGYYLYRPSVLSASLAPSIDYTHHIGAVKVIFPVAFLSTGSLIRQPWCLTRVTTLRFHTSTLVTVIQYDFRKDTRLNCPQSFPALFRQKVVNSDTASVVFNRWRRHRRCCGALCLE